MKMGIPVISDRETLLREIDMREILFRGKSKDGLRWVYGSLYKEGSQVFILVGGRFYPEPSNGQSALGIVDWYEVFPDSIGQFTNNHDYYTKEELFEGDVMERDGKRFVIKFNGCGFVGEQIGKPNFLLSLCLLCHLTSEFRLPGKKIGNIHDNPELLEIKPCHQ